MPAASHGRPLSGAQVPRTKLTTHQSQVTCLGFKRMPTNPTCKPVRAPLQLVRAPSSISHKIQHHQNLWAFFPFVVGLGGIFQQHHAQRRHQQPCLTGVSAPQTLSHLSSASMREIPFDPAFTRMPGRHRALRLSSIRNFDFSQSLILTSFRVRGPSPWLSGVPAAQARCPPQGKGQVVSENLEFLALCSIP